MRAIVRQLNSGYRPVVPSPQAGPAPEEMITEINKTRNHHYNKQLLACRILLLGDPWVGKSTIIHQFLKCGLPSDKTPTSQSNEETFTHKKTELTLSILEFSGKGSVLRDWNIARADASVLVYSFVDKLSFETVRTLKEI